MLNISANFKVTKMADHIYLSSQVLLVGIYHDIYHGRLVTLSLLGWVPLKPEYAGRGGSFTPLLNPMFDGQI